MAKKQAKKSTTRSTRAKSSAPKGKKPQPRSGEPKTKRSARSKQPTPKPGKGLQRLNKILAGAGLGSRREVEELIVQGRVEVDREIITDLSFKADPAEAKIKLDGQVVKAFRPVYFMLNKPKGVLSTNKDPSGRMRVVDLVPDRDRVFSVGRLDKSSEGLMLLTNDGELAQKLAHPKYRVQKTYFVVVSGVMTNEELAKLKKGVYLAEGFARIDGATIRKQKKASTEMEIVLSEGKNREIRRILARAGHKVVVLRRIAIGTLRLGQLPVGASRELSPTEIKALYATTEPKPKKKATKKSTKKTQSSASQPAPPEQESFDSPQPNPAMDMDDEFVAPMWSDDEHDDDFIGGFSESIGSVIGYGDEELASATSKRAKSTRRSGARGGSGAKGTAKRGGTRKAAGGKPASKRATGKRKPSPGKTSGKPAGKGKKAAGSKKAPTARRGAARTTAKKSTASHKPAAKSTKGKPAARKKTTRKRR
ncbi:MAG: pseudouridine synthase [Planctomycetota bacterium]